MKHLGLGYYHSDAPLGFRYRKSNRIGLDASFGFESVDQGYDHANSYWIGFGVPVLISGNERANFLLRTGFLISILDVRFDPETARQVVEGQYHAWDELNERYLFTGIDDSWILPEFTYAVLVFAGRWHPFHLAHYYGELPGIHVYEPGALDGDGPNIYPRQEGHVISYLFVNAWGDCPAGCIVHEYWYFTFHRRIPVFVGHWAPHQDRTEPDWWEEAEKNIRLMRGG